MSTFVFGRHLQLAALRNFHGRLRFVAGAFGDVLELVYELISIEDLAKDNVAAIKPTGFKLSTHNFQKEGLSGFTNLVMAVVMKNWEPLVSFPALAMPVTMQQLISTHEAGF